MASFVVHVLRTFALINDLLGGSIAVLAEANVGCVSCIWMKLLYEHMHSQTKYFQFHITYCYEWTARNSVTLATNLLLCLYDTHFWTRIVFSVCCQALKVSHILPEEPLIIRWVVHTCILQRSCFDITHKHALSVLWAVWQVLTIMYYVFGFVFDKFTAAYLYVTILPYFIQYNR